MEVLPNLLTQGGVTVVTIILIGVLKVTAPGFDMARFGPILAIVIGVALTALANVSLPPDQVGLSPIGVLLTGLLGGGAAVGIYAAGRGAAPALGSGPS